MSTLRDEAFEKLDYLSQLTEIVISPQNELLAEIPDCIELDIENLNKCRMRSYMFGGGIEISKRMVLKLVLPEHKQRHLDELQQCFEFELITAPELVVDFKNQQVVSGRARLVKIKTHFDERELLQKAATDAANKFAPYEWHRSALRERTVTVLNTLEPGFGSEWVKNIKGRTITSSSVIADKLEEVIKENKWRVRDVTIIEKMGEWINDYMCDAIGHSTGLVNLVKLRLMLNKDVPVYSIEEVKNDSY